MDIGAIVLAGGVGSRMRSLTDDCPKPLLPLAAEPLLGYQLRRLAAVGVRRVVLATGYLGARFETQLGDGARWGIELRHRVEDEPLGTGGAIRAAVELLPDAEPVIVVNGDLLSSHDLGGQLTAARSVDACIHVRQVPEVAPYGQVRCDGDGLVVSFAEKTGSGPGLANAGTYVVRAGLLRSLPARRSSWERDVLPGLLAAGSPIRGWAGEGYFRDVGDPAAYRQACVDAVTGVLPDSLPRDPAAYVDAGAAVAADAVVSGGSSVHAGAVVEAGAHVAGSVLLPGCRVGAGARVVRCVVAAGATVRAGSNCADRVVGP